MPTHSAAFHDGLSGTRAANADDVLTQHLFAALVEDPEGVASHLARIADALPSDPRQKFYTALAGCAHEPASAMMGDALPMFHRWLRAQQRPRTRDLIAFHLATLRLHDELGRTGSAAAEADILLEIVDAASDPAGLPDIMPVALLAVARALLTAGRIEETLVSLHDGLRWSRLAAPAHPAEPHLRRTLGLVYALVGHVDDALAQLSAAPADSTPTDRRPDCSSLRVLDLAEALVALGVLRPLEADRSVSPMRPDGGSDWWWLEAHVRARLALAGDPPTRRAGVQRLELEMLVQGSRADPAYLPGILLRSDLADLAMALDDTPTARATLDQLDLTRPHPFARLSLARLALLEQNPRAALRHLETTGSTLHSVVSGVDVIRPLDHAVLRATALDALGARSARELADALLEVRARTGTSDALAELRGGPRAECERRLGSLPPTPFPAPCAPLTRREREVLEALRLYESNADIAKALHLSPLTVKNHLQKVYRKLGVSGRHEALR